MKKVALVSLRFVLWPIRYIWFRIELRRLRSGYPRDAFSVSAVQRNPPLAEALLKSLIFKMDRLPLTYRFYLWRNSNKKARVIKKITALRSELDKNKEILRKLN